MRTLRENLLEFAIVMAILALLGWDIWWSNRLYELMHHRPATCCSEEIKI